MLMTGCGYRYEGCEGPSDSCHTVCVSYVDGDQEGLLTNEIVKAVSLSDQFVYATEGAFILKGAIIDDHKDSIGWQYERVPKTGDRFNRLISNEERREIALECVLISNWTGKVVCGPFIVKAHCDYDFVDSDSLLDTSFLTQTAERRSTLSFSLGQLSSVQDARRSALRPLYRLLAYKVVAGIERMCLSSD